MDGCWQLQDEIGCTEVYNAALKISMQLLCLLTAAVKVFHANYRHTVYACYICASKHNSTIYLILKLPAPATSMCQGLTNWSSGLIGALAISFTMTVINIQQQVTN